MLTDILHFNTTFYFPTVCQTPFIESEGVAGHIQSSSISVGVLLSFPAKARTAPPPGCGNQISRPFN